MIAAVIEFTVTRRSAAPIATVFDVMTDHRGLAATTWMFRRSTLEREGTPAPGGTGAVRRLTSYGTTFVEQIVEFQRPARWAYTLVSGAPIREHLGTIDLREVPGGTEVSWQLRGTVPVPGADRLLRPVFRWFIDALLQALIRAAERRAWPGDDSFFDTAAFVLPATIVLPHAPEQIWAALTDDRLGAWMRIVDRARWQDPPPRAQGARRSIRLLRAMTLEEEFHVWEEGRRLAFRAIAIRPRIASAWAEQAQLDALPCGGTRLTYTVAIDAPLLRLVPGFLGPTAASAARRMLRGIETVLPSPEPRA